MKNTQIILASTSPFRKQILEKLAIPFSTEKPHTDETALENETAEQLVFRLAEQKALAVANKYPDAIVIGSDQVAVVSDGAHSEILGKPGNFDNAVIQLKKLSGKNVTFFTGLSVQCITNKKIKTIVVPFEVGFRNLSDAEIASYLNKEEPYNCAGSFKSEALGITLFKHLRGDDPNTLIGLPLIDLCQILNEFGYNPLLQD